MAKKKKENKNEQANNDKLCAILSYLLIGLIWYAVDEKIRKSEFTKYHVKQGLVLFIAHLINTAIWAIPIFGWIIAPIINIGLLILLITGIINVINNKEKELPVIGQFANKFTF